MPPTRANKRIRDYFDLPDDGKKADSERSLILIINERIFI